MSEGSDAPEAKPLGISPHRQPRSLGDAYRHIQPEHFPEQIELAFISGDNREVLRYQKVRWQEGGAEGVAAHPQGLRYGENPQQRAALYRLTNDTMVFDEMRIENASLLQIPSIDLLRSGKHPSKINISDLDCALQLLRYNMDTPTAVIVKHNNPCAVAQADTISTACMRAHAADAISAFGGVVVVNRSMDLATAEHIASHYFELVAAPEYEHGTVERLQQRKNLRVVRIGMDTLPAHRTMKLFQLQTLSDLSLCLQDQYRSPIATIDDLTPAMTTRDTHEYKTRYALDTQRLSDAVFGWHVVESLWSNAVCFVKEHCTVGIGCGAVDRVGAVQIAIDKAYRGHKERFCQEHFGTSYQLLTDEHQRTEADADAILHNGGLTQSVLCSDAFFPFADGVRLAMREQVAGIVEPGGSINDWQVIKACNAGRTPLLFTGQRAFRH